MKYEDLMETGFSAPTGPKSPTQERFKAIYITGTSRFNEDAQVDEELGKLQVRGLKYNQDTVNMLITHVKSVLNNQPDRSEMPKCFCYKPADQEWVGTCGKKCPKNRAERDRDSFCKDCRSILYVAGVACEEDGTPITSVDEETQSKKPEFVFIRCYGMKYKPANDYLSELSQMDIEPPILEHNTDRDVQIEKQVMNNKRYVTNITVGSAKTRYGTVSTFNLQQGTKISEGTTKKVLDMAKKTKQEFKNKFDISSKITSEKSSGQVSGYGEETTSESPNDGNENNGSNWSFEDIDF